MAEQALKRIELIFETEVKILKYPYPGLSYFSLKTCRPLMDSCTHNPNCLSSLDSLDSLRVCRLPLIGNNNLRLVYLAVLIMAFDGTQTRLLRRIKNFAYDESQLLTYLPRVSIPEEFRQHYEDRLLRKLFVEFFHLVGSRKSPNRVVKFIEMHPILDLAFTLLFKRLFLPGQPAESAFSERLNTGEIIGVIFSKLELTPNIVERRLCIGENRYLAEDEEFTYMTYHWKDDIQLDFTEVVSDSDSDEDNIKGINGRADSSSKFSTKTTSNCNSSNTQLQQDSKRWATPNKIQQQPLFQSTVIARDQPPRLPPLPKSPNVHEMHKVKAGYCMDEMEMKCGDIKNKIRKLESDVESYNNNPQRVGSKNQGLVNRIYPPLSFKERQPERKQSTECQTSFFKDKIPPTQDKPLQKPTNQKPSTTTPTSNPNGLSPATFSLTRLISTPTRTSQYTPSYYIRQYTPNTSIRQYTPQRYSATPIDSGNRSTVTLKSESSSLQRTNSNIERLSESRRIVTDSELKISSSSSLLLKENPRKILVRKI